MKPDLDKYAEWTDTTWLGSTGRDALLIATLGLCGEAGEVAEKIKKFARGDGSFSETDLMYELGDVLYYLARLCRLNNISMDGMLQANIQKLESRRARGVQRGNGDHR
jgi:NTP pyrophosphatase (non-canonical NTP hydrolase)